MNIPKIKSGWLLHYVPSDDPAIFDEWADFNHHYQEFTSKTKAKKAGERIIKKKLNYGAVAIMPFRYVFELGGWIREEDTDNLIEIF